MGARAFQGAFVASALRKSCSRVSAWSPSTGGMSELMEVEPLPGSTVWTGGGGSSSWVVARPDSTMKGRLCCTYSGGYASIATTPALLQGHEDAGCDGCDGCGGDAGVRSTIRSLRNRVETPCAVLVRMCAGVVFARPVTAASAARRRGLVVKMS